MIVKLLQDHHLKESPTAEPNRLWVITIPHFDAADDHFSDKI
jgi:hypothetical protein